MQLHAIEAHADSLLCLLAAPGPTCAGDVAAQLADGQDALQRLRALTQSLSPALQQAAATATAASTDPVLGGCRPPQRGWRRRSYRGIACLRDPAPTLDPPPPFLRPAADALWQREGRAGPPAPPGAGRQQPAGSLEQLMESIGAIPGELQGRKGPSPGHTSAKGPPPRGRRQGAAKGPLPPRGLSRPHVLRALCRAGRLPAGRAAPRHAGPSWPPDCAGAALAVMGGADDAAPPPAAATALLLTLGSALCVAVQLGAPGPLCAVHLAAYAPAELAPGGWASPWGQSAHAALRRVSALGLAALRHFGSQAQRTSVEAAAAAAEAPGAAPPSQLELLLLWLCCYSVRPRMRGGWKGGSTPASCTHGLPCCAAHARLLGRWGAAGGRVTPRRLPRRIYTRAAAPRAAGCWMGTRPPGRCCRRRCARSACPGGGCSAPRGGPRSGLHSMSGLRCADPLGSTATPCRTAEASRRGAAALVL